jgi:hypothetical protein
MDQSFWSICFRDISDAKEDLQICANAKTLLTTQEKHNEKNVNEEKFFALRIFVCTFLFGQGALTTCPNTHQAVKHNMDDLIPGAVDISKQEDYMIIVEGLTPEINNEKLRQVFLPFHCTRCRVVYRQERFKGTTLFCTCLVMSTHRICGRELQQTKGCRRCNRSSASH